MLNEFGTIEKCLWGLDHPVEWKCEKLSKIHGGYWDCLRFEYERIDRKIDRELTEKFRKQQLLLIKEGNENSLKTLEEKIGRERAAMRQNEEIDTLEVLKGISDVLLIINGLKK
jgi:hypothetical protein